jgi:hypothetical protein
MTIQGPLPFFKTILLILLAGGAVTVRGQDSVAVRIHPSYGHAGGLHRWLLGENYRKEWSMDIRLPMIHVSSFSGGLTPERLRGGKQIPAAGGQGGKGMGHPQRGKDPRSGGAGKAAANLCQRPGG